jgi:hypothetical protein
VDPGVAVMNPVRKNSTGNTKVPDDDMSSKALEVYGNHNCN